MKMTELSW